MKKNKKSKREKEKIIEQKSFFASIIVRCILICRFQVKEKIQEREREKILERKPFFANLPQDIINNILLRLPVKTLVCCRYVCRLWLSLISNPFFIQTHLQKSNLSNNNSDHKIIFNVSGYHLCYESHIKSLSLDNESNVVVLDYLNINPRNHARIIGSCNGLVCIYSLKLGIFIWNPCTGISKKLPHSGFKDRLTDYGFGYDPISDDYKVVFMVYADRFKRKRVVRVYSLKSNSWGKTVDLHCNGSPYHSEGQYINGVLYWGMFYSADFHPVIVSLDLGNETFREIEQPCREAYMGLGVLEGCLSVFCHFKDHNRILRVKFCTEVWVMKEDGVRDTWTKLYTIPYTDKHNHSWSFYIPLCISMTGEILLADGDSLVLYNPNNGSFRNPNFNDWSVPSLTLAYVESLVSPNIYEEALVAQH